MSLFHDIGESIIGDFTPHDGISDDIKHAMETAAVDKLASHLISERGAELQKLFHVWIIVNICFRTMGST
jgi:putative hydrolase of HD superfamily